MTPWKERHEYQMPYQDWRPFPPEAIVQVRNAYGDSRIGAVSSFWWGFEMEIGKIGEGVIIKARRLDKPLTRQEI